MIDLLYILAPGHSGSTLLGMLLGAHPDVATVGEVKMVAQAYRLGEECSCGTTMDRCSFWREVSRRLLAEGFDLRSPGVVALDGGRGDFAERLVTSQVGGRISEQVRKGCLCVWPAARLTWQRTCDYNIAIIREILSLTEGQVFLDTSKEARRLRDLSQTGRFRIKVLHLIRDGRGVAYSLISKGVDARSAARAWIGEHHQAERLRATQSGLEHWMRVRYEDFCADPSDHLASILRFVGLSPTDASLDFRSWESHVLGNRLRLANGKEIVLDEAWRDRLRGDDLRIVEELTSDTNRRYGYLS